SCMQADTNSRRQDRPRLNLLPHSLQYLLRCVERVCTVAPVRKRRTKHRHETIAKKLINDPMMAVHDFNHELKQRLELLNHFRRTSLLRKAREVSNVEKHHAYVLAFTSQIRLEVEQLAHHFRRYVLTKSSRYPVSLFDNRKRFEDAPA